MLSGKTNQYLEDFYEIVEQPNCENQLTSDIIKEAYIKNLLVDNNSPLTNVITSANFYVLDNLNLITNETAFLELEYNSGDTTGANYTINLKVLYYYPLFGGIHKWVDIPITINQDNPSGKIMLNTTLDSWQIVHFLFYLFIPLGGSPTGAEFIEYDVYESTNHNIEYEDCEGNIITIPRLSQYNSANGTIDNGTYFIGSTSYSGGGVLNPPTAYYTEKGFSIINYPAVKYIKKIEPISGKEEIIEAECICNEDTTLCDFDKITFYQNCGEVKEVLADFGVYNGAYEFTTKSFTGLNGQIVYPTATQQAVYDLVFNSYSDDFFLELQELIANNVYIKIKGFEYIFRKETFEPAWQNPDLIAQTSIKIIRKNTIKTIKKNCCES